MVADVSSMAYPQLLYFLLLMICSYKNVVINYCLLTDKALRSGITFAA